MLGRKATNIMLEGGRGGSFGGGGGGVARGGGMNGLSGCASFLHE